MLINGSPYDVVTGSDGALWFTLVHQGQIGRVVPGEGPTIFQLDPADGRPTVITVGHDGHFAVAVADTGPGIPPEEQNRIFDEFHQVDASNTKAKGGTGLGLAIAKQIIEMHGGRIWVESSVGKGATFQMKLPIRAEHRTNAA